MTRKQAKSIFTIHTNGEDEYVKVDKRIFTSFIDRVYDDFEAKDKLKKCNNCKHKDGESGTLTHCSYFEEFMPTEIGKCDIWESKNAR